ncbi:MAG: response regulator [Gammaproteobacteria bacterium]|nr:response regulator [Gammaproteobacteria bacterium]
MTIRNKLVLYTIGTIVITLLLTGFAIDLILTDLYNNNARTELDYSYTQLKNRLASIHSDILDQSTQISADQSVIAVTNLVQRYQDTINYQPLIFDNEKKKIAVYLQKQIALSESDRVMMYANDGSLIAYAIQDKLSRTAGIVSYKKGIAVYINNHNQSDNWMESGLPTSIAASIPELGKLTSFLSHSGEIKYFSAKDTFTVENSRVITRYSADGSVQLLGVIRTSKSLDAHFFKGITDNANIKISLLLHNGSQLNARQQLLPVKNLPSSSLLHGDTYPATKALLDNKKYYLQSYVWPTAQGNNYLLISLPKSGLVSALNQTRVYLLIIFSIIAVFIILSGVYWLNRLISRPLNELVEQTKLSNRDGYPVFTVKKGDDEISQLGLVLNKMVKLIEAREKDLIERTQRLNDAQHLAKVGDWELDTKTESMQWSNEAYNIFGYTAGGCTPTLDAIIAVMHPDDKNNALQAYQVSLENRQSFNFTHRIINKEKEIKYVNVYGEHLFDDAGNAVRSIGTMQDITEQVTKDEQLRRTQKMDALGKLTGGVAHDFNNMLGIIMGFTELLENSLQENDLKRNLYTHEILQATERATKLTAKLLNFSRKETATASKANINELLLGERHMLEKTLTVRIQLILDLENHLWHVWLDKDELEDAIINMAINSMHAIINEGELRLSTQNISLSQIDVQNLEIPAGDYVLLSIADTGSGMDRDTLQHIFEPFFTTKKDKGTGLGMSQVYGFVKRCKGAIHINSEPQHGTRISIYMPRYHEREKILATVNESNAHKDLKGNARILVVDDEPGLRMLAKEILTSYGYSVSLAESASQALALLKEQEYELMLSDVIMPGMNGYELAKKVSELYPAIKIQMASGFSDNTGTSTGNEALYTQRLQKPFTADALLQRIKTLLS